MVDLHVITLTRTPSQSTTQQQEQQQQQQPHIISDDDERFQHHCSCLDLKINFCGIVLV